MENSRGVEMDDNIVGRITKILRSFFMVRKCKKENMRTHEKSICEGPDSRTGTIFLYAEKSTGRQSKGAAQSMEICGWREDPFLPSLFFFFFFILSYAPCTPGISKTLFLSILTEQFILLLAAKLAPSVIISWCFCAFTYVSQQGPVFGSDRLPCSPPPSCDVDPSKKISQEVFKLPFGVGFFFRASRFHYNTLAFAFRVVYIGSALFSFLGYPFI